MKRTLLFCLVSLATLQVATASVLRVAGEPSRTPALKTAQAWRAGEVAITQLRYAELPASRILELQQRNVARAHKAMQIGIARDAARESTMRALPALQWSRQHDGSHVARIELHSPLAYGIRAGLDIEGLDPRVELRFGGSARKQAIVAMVRAGQIASLRGDDGLYWTPATEGETQSIELWAPAGVSLSQLRFSAPRLSHLMTNAVDDFRILKNVGASGSCNIDTVCRAGTLGAGFATAQDAVARMTYVKDGGSYLCSGTLLNDTVAGSQIPWFHTAAHCISTQAVASTLNTYWKYEAPTCGANAVGAYVQLSGGADLLYASIADDDGTDGALLRLREPAPAGTTFAGWDASPLGGTGSVTAIHHPAGDVKKVSFGQSVPAQSDAASVAVSWREGTTEGGSSGSGLFTQSGGSYHLRGGLHGGNAMCSNSGGTVEAGNIDWYSRFEVDFPSLSRYLAPVAPQRRNGAQPLAPPR